MFQAAWRVRFSGCDQPVECSCPRVAKFDIWGIQITVRDSCSKSQQKEVEVVQQGSSQPQNGVTQYIMRPARWSGPSATRLLPGAIVITRKTFMNPAKKTALPTTSTKWSGRLRLQQQIRMARNSSVNSDWTPLHASSTSRAFEVSVMTFPITHMQATHQVQNFTDERGLSGPVESE